MWCSASFNPWSDVFSIISCDLFLFLQNVPIANADGNSPICAGMQISNVLNSLKIAAQTLLKLLGVIELRLILLNTIGVNNAKETCQIPVANVMPVNLKSY